MEVNNFKIIRSLLNFESSDDFYFLQIIKRKKENPEISSNHNNNKRAIRTYYISSYEYFDNIESEVKSICKATNSRAYIHPTKRSFKKTGLQALQEMVTCIQNDNFLGMYECFNASCGTPESRSGKKYFIDYYDYSIKHIWVVDIDEATQSKLQIYRNGICSNKIIQEIPTKNGVHFLCKPFNVDEFNSFCNVMKVEIPDIQKNNPTLLYYSN